MRWWSHQHDGGLPEPSFLSGELGDGLGQGGCHFGGTTDEYGKDSQHQSHQDLSTHSGLFFDPVSTKKIGGIRRDI